MIVQKARGVLNWQQSAFERVMHSARIVHFVRANRVHIGHEPSGTPQTSWTEDNLCMPR